MSIYVPDNTTDQLLDEIATCTRLDITSDVSTPTDLTNTLANVTLTAGDGNGDYTIADGAIDGRKLTITTQVDIPITSTGTAKHVVLSLGGTIKYITTTSDLSMDYGAGSNVVTTPEFTHTVRDAT